jgi:hypothetical protein
VNAFTTIRVQHWARAAAAMAVLSLAGAGSAAAQAGSPPPTTSLTDTGTWTVTPFIGVGFSGDLDSATTVIGVAGGYTWSPRISLEGEFSALPSSELSGFVEVDNNLWTLTGNVLYHFTGKVWVPYAALGLGFGHSSVDIDANGVLPAGFSDSSTQFVGNFGGGAERQIRSRLAFRGDVRYFFGSNLVPDYWRVSAGVSFQLPKR